MGETRNAYGILIGKPGRKRLKPLERCRFSWEDIIKMDRDEADFCEHDNFRVP
jgi:hypothetical protein